MPHVTKNVQEPAKCLWPRLSQSSYNSNDYITYNGCQVNIPNVENRCNIINKTNFLPAGVDNFLNNSEIVINSKNNRKRH